MLCDPVLMGLFVYLLSSSVCYNPMVFSPTGAGGGGGSGGWDTPVTILTVFVCECLCEGGLRGIT